jgi:hypothetical protein
MFSTAMTHLKHLAVTIGPRGSTTPQERQAAKYAQQHFETLGLQTHWEEFIAPKTGWRPFSVAAIIGLGSVLLFWLGGQIGALVAGVVMVITSASVFMEMYFQPNPLRILMPKAPSQNVWACIPAANEVTRRVLIVGHIDTHRTPWVFSSVNRLAFFRLMTTLGVAAFVLAALFYLLSVLIDLSLIHWLVLVLVPIYLIVLALTWQPDTTPYTHGANDNGSGASIVLSLSERLVRSPLKHVDVWVMCSGCEEVGSYGVQAFVKRHRSELARLIAINIDNVGGKGAGVCYTSVEGMVIRYKPVPELIGLAETIKAERPDFNAYAKPFTTLHTDATCLMVNKVPSLSFVGLTPDGVIPNWHQVTDTFERVDATPIECTEEFVLELLRRLDAV